MYNFFVAAAYLLGVFEKKCSGAKRNKTKFYSMIGGSKPNEISFRNISNFFIVTHLCHLPSSKLRVTMVIGHSVRLMPLWCKARSSHGMSRTFHGLISSA